jgi:hypothetical protein
MRNNIFKDIAVFFLCVASLAIIAHMIIPHDHHLMESAGSQEESCPVSNDHSNHHSGFPVHCHMCNDITSEKAVLLTVLKNLECNCIIITGLIDFTTLKLNITGIKFYEFTGLPYKSENPDLSSLRAPPAYV